MGGRSGGGGRAGRSSGGGGASPTMSDAFDNHETNVDASEKDAIHSYSGAMYSYVNESLISNKNWSEQTTANVNNVINKIDIAMSKNQLTADTSVYRGVSPNMIERFGKTGTVFNHKPYASTSDSINQSIRFSKKDSSGNIHLMEIKAKTGTKAISMKGISKYPDEREVLLNRGTKMKYTGKYTKVVSERTPGGSLTGQEVTAIIHTFETVP